MTQGQRSRLSRRLVWLAAAAGLLHATASVYWAAGGRFLLASVGQWAVDLAAEAPGTARAVLGVVAFVKVLAAVIPVGVAYGKVPWPRLWRAVSWTGGLLLVLYGAVNVLVSSAVLAGLIRPERGYDATAMKGHALLWDPLFLLWGAALVASLWLSRQPSVESR